MEFQPESIRVLDCNFISLDDLENQLFLFPEMSAECVLENLKNNKVLEEVEFVKKTMPKARHISAVI